MAILQDKVVTVIVEVGSPLKPDEVDEAIGGMSNLSFRALVQLINDYRHEAATKAAGYVTQDNAMATAGEARVYEALSGLIEDLQARRKPTE